MFISLGPLVRHRDFRWLYLGEFASSIGSMLTYVALPYQLFQLTHSSFAVGMVGIAQLVPLLLTALVGGAFADMMDRRKLLMLSQVALLLCSLAFAFNTIVPHPQLWVIYVAAALASAASGFHGPTLQAMTPRLVSTEDIPAIGALNALKGTAAAVAGPALGGMLIANFGVAVTYWIDAASFLVFLAALLLMKPMPPSATEHTASLNGIVDGFRYAGSRQDLIGTYVVDIVAMIFGMPMALFPEISEHFGGAKALGWLYVAFFAGAFLASLVSGWTKKVTRHGAAIAIAAGVWGVAIAAFGLSTWLPLSLLMLAVAGGADMVSGVFRQLIWNTTIPDQIRGRLAGIEMLSYMSGPLLGNAESGLVSAVAGTQFSVVSGGVLCVLGVILCARALPLFWRYDFRPAEEADTPQPAR